MKSNATLSKPLDDSLLDDLFTGCAIAAFVEEAQIAGRLPAEEATRLRAYAYYEAALAQKNADKDRV